MTKNPYKVIKSRHVTEKSVMLEGLKDAKSNKCVARCQSPKYVFLVDPSATKPEIKAALEEIYADQKITVKAVNTVRLKGKQRRVRGRLGRTALRKKAVVTLAENDVLDSNL